MPRNVTESGRPRNSNEVLFTAALMEELDRERNRRSMDQRSFAGFLHVHESLLSLYRNGQRFPSVPGFIELEKQLPGLMMRVVQNYYGRLRRRDAQAAGPVDDQEDDTRTPPAERVGAYALAGALR